MTVNSSGWRGHIEQFRAPSSRAQAQAITCKALLQRKNRRSVLHRPTLLRERIYSSESPGHRSKAYSLEGADRMTPRKSQPPLMIIMHSIGWGLCRTLCRWFPGLGRAFNFPLREAFVGAYANAVLEDSEQQIALTPDGLDTARSILKLAMPNDVGDTSTYPSGRSKVRSLLL